MDCSQPNGKFYQAFSTSHFDLIYGSFRCRRYSDEKLFGTFGWKFQQFGDFLRAKWTKMPQRSAFISGLIWMLFSFNDVERFPFRQCQSGPVSYDCSDGQCSAWKTSIWIDSQFRRKCHVEYQMVSHLVSYIG